MRKISGFIIINMENTYTGETEQVGDKIFFLSNKKEFDELSVINKSLEKYTGILVTRYKAGIFRAEITIPIPIN